jgi:NhaP-type Na+/H+ or K+/H+ antiporter
MGLTLQREAVPGERQLRRFKETLTIMGISILFVLLSANLRIESVRAEGISGVLTVLLIMFVARPVSVLIATWFTELTWREKILIAWIGPRGIVAASVASLFAITLETIGIAEGDRLIALTFLTIAITVTVQGLSAQYLARFLGLQSMEGRKAIIVGASHFGCMVAKILTDHGRPVTLVDTNMHLSECAFRYELEAVNGNALEEDILEQAGAEEGETMIALTANPEINVLACQVAHESFGITRAYPVLIDPERGTGPELLKQTGGKLAFGRAFDIHSWEYNAGFRLNRFEWEVPPTWQNTMIRNIPFPEDILPIIRLKDNSAEVVYAEQIWQSGDKVVFLSKISEKTAIGMLDALSL